MRKNVVLEMMILYEKVKKWKFKLNNEKTEKNL